LEEGNHKEGKTKAREQGDSAKIEIIYEHTICLPFSGKKPRRREDNCQEEPRKNQGLANPTLEGQVQ
jgi:hypothetical protein